jgi:hypothetical protein
MPLVVTRGQPDKTRNEDAQYLGPVRFSEPKPPLETSLEFLEVSVIVSLKG